MSGTVESLVGKPAVRNETKTVWSRALLVSKSSRSWADMVEDEDLLEGSGEEGIEGGRGMGGRWFGARSVGGGLKGD